MTKSERFDIVAIDEALHDLRAIESEAMDSLRPRCAFRGFLDLASALGAIAARMPDLVIVGDLPRAGFAASGLYRKLRGVGFEGSIAIISSDSGRALNALPEGEMIVACIAKKSFSRATFQEMIRKAGGEATDPTG